MFSIIRVQIAPQVLNAENEVKLLKLANAQSAMYKPFKLFFDERGNLMLDVCLVTEEDKFDGNKVYKILSVIINYLDGNYRNIMKEVWQ